MAFDKRRNLDILLGVFICCGIVLFGFFIFILGKEKHLFDRSAHLNTYFKSAAGLSVGADVMLAGVLVGNVDQIAFPDLKDKNPQTLGKIRVVIKIPNANLAWIRQNSNARIDGKGLLGDKIINISLGTSDASPIHDNDVLASMESLDFSDALAKAQDVLEHVIGAIQTAKIFLEGLTHTGSSIQNIVKGIESGNGLVNRLIFKKQAADNFESTLANLEKILGKVKNSEIMGDLSEIIKETKEGQGTLGRFLVDPSIYDDLKLILGNVERNRILKALIRFSLSQKDTK